MHASEEDLDAVLLACVSPLLERFGDDPGVASLVFHRHVKPDWNVRLTLEGTPGAHLRFREERPPLAEGTPLRRWEMTDALPACPEESGDAARLMHEDGRACLAFLECERRGGASRSRREYSVLLVERLLGLFAFDRADRLAFYRVEAGEPFAREIWDDRARATLEARYQDLRDDLSRFLREDDWGGADPAGIATALLAASRPIVERLRASDRDLVPLAAGLARRHGNRLGIHGLGEAAMRYFVMRLHQDERIPCP